MGRMHKSYCCVSTCRNTSYTRRDLTFFTLPADTDRRLQWLPLIGREDMVGVKSYFRYYSVCEEHFSPDSLRETNFRKLLVPHALPTLCLPRKQETNEEQASTSISTRNEATQTPKNQNTQIKLETETHTDKHIEPSYSQKITPAQETRWELEKLSLLHTNYQLSELIKCDKKVTTSRTSVNQYEGYRQFCLNLYYGSSQGYRLLQSAVRLPNLTTMYKHIPITTEINDRLMNALQMKIETMSIVEFQCVVVIDSMPLTPGLFYNDKIDRIEGLHEVNGIQSPIVAERALVMMIHGMFSEWQQPVGYALLSHMAVDGKLAHWINELINKLCDVGLSIRILSFASQTEADFFEERWASVDAPYFFMKKRKISYISDPKMLLNALRNDLSLYDICYCENRVAKFEHIEQFYNKDKNSQYRLAPNLTDSHIHPTDTDKKDSVELFSKTVASGLSAYIDSKQIDKSGRDTVDLIVKISDIFSLFNSSNDINSNNRVFNGDKSHASYMKQVKIFFQELKLIDSKNKKDVTHTAKFVRGFLMNLNSYLRLSEEFAMENLSKIPIRTLNQGMTEDFFEKIRLKSNATKPTVEQFGIAFRQLYVLDAIKPLKNRSTPAYHSHFFLRSKKAIVHQGAIELSKYMHELKDVPHFISAGISNSEEISNIQIPESDYNHIDRTERHSLIYVSGYLLKKCKENHKHCETFKKYAEGTSEKITLNHISRYLLYSQKNQLSLISIPCNHFVIIVDRLEDVFRKFFKRNNNTNCKIVQTMYEEMRLLNIGIPPCPCFPWGYFIKLFIRLRIAYTIHLNNKEIARKQKEFVVPLLLSETSFLKM